jgi:3-methylcrotonyl-CoA carboxylase alpha subunit
MFESLLIANRGEIACRIIRTARRMGIRTIAVFSEADAGAQHVLAADEAYPIGPAPAAESYLRADVILDVARRAGAGAVHPGYGFLSENAAFAEACAAAGIAFIGPTADAIRAMGSKAESKRLMVAAGVPTVPGYHGEAQDEALLAAEAARIGFPVLIKASAGGGGKGMRPVLRAEDFAAELAGARREALAAFGDERVLLEKYLGKAAPCGGAGAGRPSRAHHPPAHPRLLGAATPPEGAGGGAGARSVRRPAGAAAPGRHRRGGGGGLPQRRHGGVHRGRRRRPISWR